LGLEVIEKRVDAGAGGSIMSSVWEDLIKEQRHKAAATLDEKLRRDVRQGRHEWLWLEGAGLKPGLYKGVIRRLAQGTGRGRRIEERFLDCAGRRVRRSERGRKNVGLLRSE